ncbi:Hypothetical predicted protein [Podarcis lilfordi]|uniref:Uncharacterized protein n=1 Tax=Podarcis lilfordi TaxID=74358 RepID=A0AA35KSU3_9SAUR|nr:Hypothetical predicted protein [Podarcis lilfordi]
MPKPARAEISAPRLRGPLREQRQRCRCLRRVAGMPKPARAEISAPRLRGPLREQRQRCRCLRRVAGMPKPARAEISAPRLADLSASSGSAAAACGELPACRSLRALRSARPGSRTSPRAAAALPLLAESCRHAEACAR